MPSAGRSHRAYIKACKELRATAPAVCAWCSKPIDLTLHHTDPWSWTADHIIPLVQCLAQGIDPNDISNLQPMHRRCNSSKGAGPQPTPPPRTSRRWH